MKEKLKHTLSLLISIIFLYTIFPMSAVASSGLKLNKTSVILAEGETFSLKNTSSGKGSISWKSSKSSVASVDKNGTIKAKKAGKATITASTDGVKKKCSVTVKSSKKSAALANYEAFLEKDRISWGPKSSGGSVSAEHCEFQLIYIDNDSVPELVLEGHMFDGNDVVSHATGYSQLYCYRNGTVNNISVGDWYQYYPKKGVYISGYVNLGRISKEYYKLSKGKTRFLFSSDVPIPENTSGDGDEYYYGSNRQSIDKVTFNKLRKKAVGTTKRKDVDEKKFHVNTKKNRKKYLS